MDKSLKSKTISGFIWKFLQNAGTQIIGFIISLVLARILTPDDYGVVAMITVFTNIAMVFINTGFSSAIIQKKELSEKDINTMFYSGIGVSLFLYAILYFAAPYISIWYHEPRLTSLLRVQSLVIVIGALYSVQRALIARDFKFKKSFYVGLCGVGVHGVVGIILALLGFGAWALVYSSLVNYAVAAVLMWCIVKWKPKFIFSGKSFKNMFGFSMKMLASGLLDSIFNNIRSIIIGTQYSGKDLAYYNKGYQFPTLVMTQVDGATTTVLFSSLSKYQSDWENGLKVLRRAMKTSLYVCAPLMAGMCAVADPMIRILLTDKWADSIVYVRLVAIICLFWPLSAQRHALNSLGKSGVSLRLNIIGKSVTVVCLLLTFRHSVQLMIASSIFASMICLVINAFVYRKHLQYQFKHQIADILPPIVLSAVMGFATYSVMFLNLSSILTLLIQVPLGILIYVAGSKLFKFESFEYLWGMLKGFLKKHKKPSVQTEEESN